MERKTSNSKFSVALGLFDYINPIFYAVTSITIIINLYHTMDKGLFIVMLAGCMLSMIFGLSIPTLKLIVGLGKIKFKMPVNLVFCVNCGLFITGLALFKYIFSINYLIMLAIIIISLFVLTMIYLKTKKFNTIAVLIGLVGYGFIHASLIMLATKIGYIVPIILYAIAVLLQIFLVLIGCFSDLNLPRVHWTLEITNVMCQGIVAISTILLFNNFKL